MKIAPSAPLWLAGLVTVAWAWPSPASAEFATLDRQQPGFMALAQFDYTLVDDSDIDFLRTDLYGHASFGMFGAYANLAFANTFGARGDELTAIGNLDIGGLAHFGFGPISVVARLGLGLPTASTELDKALTNAGSRGGRLTDTALALPDRFTLRTSASALVDLGFFFARADLGFDSAFDTGDGDAATSSDLNLDSFLLAGGGEDGTLGFLHANVGVGASLGFVELTAELVNVKEVVQSDTDFRHTFAVVLHGNLFSLLRAFVGYTMPLEEDQRGDIHVLNFGIQANL